MQYKILQLKANHPSFGERAFQDLNAIGGVVDLDAYQIVYSGDLMVSENDAGALNMLFRRFNIEHPEDYTGRSMSVSDIVTFDNVRFYYCLTVGWGRLLPEQIAGALRRNGQ